MPRLFKVVCPANLLWHPSLHHSLLLLRALRQPHTLQLTPPFPTPMAGPFPLLASPPLPLRISCEDLCGAEKGLSQPELLPLLLLHDRVKGSRNNDNNSSNPSENKNKNDELKNVIPDECESTLRTPDRLREVLPAYWDTAALATQLLHLVDAVLVAMASDSLVPAQALHRALWQQLEELEAAVLSAADDDEGVKTHSKHAPANLMNAKNEEGSQLLEEEVETTKKAPHPPTQKDSNSPMPSFPSEGASGEAPLRTWPLYTVLAFLIEQAGLLTSAFPRLHQAYTRVRTQNPAIRLHSRFLRHHEAQVGDPTVRSGKYPGGAFLHDFQRWLASEAGAGVPDAAAQKPGRGGSARLGGVQAVPARLPWPMQRTKLPWR